MADAEQWSPYVQHRFHPAQPRPEDGLLGVAQWADARSVLRHQVSVWAHQPAVAQPMALLMKLAAAPGLPVARELLELHVPPGLPR